MATGGFSKSNINFFRSGSALLNVGAPTLRKLLEQKASLTPGMRKVEDLLLDQTNKHKFQRMSSRVLTTFQLEMLYPASGDSPNIDTWDITLLCVVLSTVCSLSLSEESCIRQIRGLRNTVYGHKAEASMDDAEFDNVWKEIETAIEGLLNAINCPNVCERVRENLEHIKHDQIDTGELEREIEIFLHREDDMIDKVEELQEKITNIYNRVDEIGQTVAKSLETTTTENQPAGVHGLLSREDLQRHLLDMYDNFSVPVAPLLSEEEDVNISDLYADLSVYDVTERQRFSASVGVNEGNAITNYREMFQTGCTRSHRRYFLVGNAGSGKSTYCRKLLSTWCSALNKKPLENRHLSEDEKQMLEFDFVFLIPLCDVVNCSSVEDMIQEVFAQRAIPNLLENILATLGSPETRCLLILDGLDEWDSQSDKNLKRLFKFNCSTVATTRHWALERVPKNLQGRLLEIKPMEERNTRLLVGNILHHVYHVSKTRIENKVEQFLHQMKWNNLMEIAEIPLMLTYFVCLWYEEAGLDASITGNYGGVIENLIEYCVRRDLHHSFSDRALEFHRQTIKLPSSLMFRKHCVENSFVLYKLGYFAFEKLLDDSRGTVTYDMNVLESRIGKSALDMGLKIGILSKRRVTGHVAVTHHKVQFLHRSIQEFLAALWITHSDTAVGRLKSYCSSLENLLDLQNVFRFICGLKPSLYNSLSKFAVRVASNSDEIQTYRHSLDNLYTRKSFRDNAYHIAKEVQDMFVMALKEARCNWKYVGSKQGDFVQQYQGGIFYLNEISPKCHIQDLIIDDETEATFGNDLFDKDLKSLHVDSSYQHVEAIRDHIMASKIIERLHLDSSMSEVLLGIPNVHLRRLRSLTVTLKRVSSLPEYFQHIRHLSALCLCITGSHSTIASLMEFFRNTASLTDLEIEQIECVDHTGLSEECKFDLDLSKNSSLKRLSIDKVSKVSIVLMPDVELKDVSLHGRMRNPLAILLCLPWSGSLTHLTLGELLVFRLFQWDKTDIKAIIKVLPTLKRLKYLHLMGINFNDGGLVFPQEGTELETVYMEDVMMSGDSWTRTLRSLIAIDGKLSKTNVLISSSSVDNMVVHFINETERFEDVVVTTRSDGYMIRFDIN